MTSVEQRKMVQKLKQVLSRMSSDERRAFEMIAKRDRDDEDLDVLTMSKLRQMHKKFFPKQTKQEIQEKWRQLTGGK